MKLIPYLLGTALTLLPSSVHGDEYQVISYKANKMKSNATKEELI